MSEIAIVPFSKSWVVLKNRAMTVEEWDGKGSGDGSFVPNGALNSSGSDMSSEFDAGDADTKRREAEIKHNLSVNNRATQVWVDSFLPDALNFSQQLVGAQQSPGIAIHDTNFKQHQKQLDGVSKKLNEMIAHFTSHRADTPGPGRGKSKVPSLLRDKDDDEGY